MQKPFLLLFSLVSILYSCKTINIHRPSQIKTIHQVQLGSIGSDKDFLLQKGFNNVAIPNYKASIKLAITNAPFNKYTYKSFIKANNLQSADISILYIDSIPKKPTYIQLQIADRVAVVEALNELENKGVKDYLSHNASANVIATISIAFNNQDLELIRQSDAVFLVETSLKTYTLELRKEGKKIKTIPFNKGVVFQYKTSHCCWQEDKRHRLNIVDLVSEFNNCPNKTYRNSNRAKKKGKLF